MKNNIKIIIGLMLISSKIVSQNITGEVKYEQILSYFDTTKYMNASPMKLQFDSQKAIYYRDGYIKTPRVADSISINTKKTSTLEGVSTNLETNQMNYWFNLSKWVFISDTMQTTVWDIKNKFKKIGEVNCQLATGFVKGREYDVWFAPEIPLGFGPWKINGLPGLVLEAKSRDKEIYFKFLSLKIPYQFDKPMAELPKVGNFKTMLWKDCAKELKRTNDNLIKMTQTQPNSNNSGYTKRLTIEVVDGK